MVFEASKGGSMLPGERVNPTKNNPESSELEAVPPCAMCSQGIRD